MIEWSDNESNTVNIVILPPEIVESLVHDKEVQCDNEIIDNNCQVVFVIQCRSKF